MIKRKIVLKNGKIVMTKNKIVIKHKIVRENGKIVMTNSRKVANNKKVAKMTRETLLVILGNMNVSK